jgi:hypothetical protein
MHINTHKTKWLLKFKQYVFFFAFMIQAQNVVIVSIFKQIMISKDVIFGYHMGYSRATIKGPTLA